MRTRSGRLSMHRLVRGLCVLQWFVWTQSWVTAVVLTADCCATTWQQCCAHLLAMAGHLSARVAAEPCAGDGARRVARYNSFEIHSAWSVCAAVRTVLCKDAQQMHAAVGSGGEENVKFM